jgi:hypothetical protein
VRPDLLVAISGFIAIGSDGARANAEHWLCDTKSGEHIYTQEWIITDASMLASKAKVEMPVIVNNETVTVAYLPLDNGALDLFVLDKRVKVLTDVSDRFMPAFVGFGVTGRQDPELTKASCRRRD